MPREKKPRLTSRRRRNNRARSGKPPRENQPVPVQEEVDGVLTVDDRQNTPTYHVAENVSADVNGAGGQDETEGPSSAKRPRFENEASSAIADGQNLDEQQNERVPLHLPKPAINISVCSSQQGISLSSSDNDVPLIRLVERERNNKPPFLPVVEDRPRAQVIVQSEELPVEPLGNSSSSSHDDVPLIKLVERKRNNRPSFLPVFEDSPRAQVFVQIEEVSSEPFGNPSLSSDDDVPLIRFVEREQKNQPPSVPVVEDRPRTPFFVQAEAVFSDSSNNEEREQPQVGQQNRPASPENVQIDPEDLQLLIRMVQNDDDDIFEGPVDPDFAENDVIVAGPGNDNDRQDNPADGLGEPERAGQIAGYLRATRRDVVEPHNGGPMNRRCPICRAKHFESELTTRGTYNKCCAQGRVVLHPLGDHPQFFRELFEGRNEFSREFKSNILAYNNAFQFSSFEANLRNIPGRGPYVFAIQGQVYHHYSDINVNRNRQAFGPIYFLDPDEAARQRVENAEQYGNARLNMNLVRRIGTELHQHNPLAREYRHLHEEYELQRQRMAGGPFQLPTVCLEFVAHHRNRHVEREHDPVQAQKIAAVCPFHENREPNPNMRVFLRNQDTGTRAIDFDSPMCDPLVFPLLFPTGDEGWNWRIPLINNNGRPNARQRVTLCQYYSYRLAYRYDDDDQNHFDVFRRSGKLNQKFIVGAYLKIEANRIKYFRSHQDELRSEEYDGLVDYLHNRAEREDVAVGRMVVLPSSFVMSPRSQMQRFQDAMATVRKVGCPTVFITFTCNPKWPEITGNIPQGDEPSNHPLLVCRVFQMKLKELMADLVERHVAGRCIAHLCVIEFQKRGLPHDHILITLANEDRPNDAERIDLLVSAEIPDPQTERQLYDLVGRHMIHGPCGCHNLRSVCMVNDRCTKQFPKYYYNNTTVRNGRVNYRRREDDRRIEINRYIVRYHVDNSFDVPYNPYLLMKYQTHINVEVCANIGTVKYLYKYFFKSQDRIVINVVQRHQRQNADENNDQNEEGRIDYDEIRSYLNGRYMTPPEAGWHILQFDMHSNSHHVERLQIHLPGRHRVIFRDGQEQEVANAHFRTQLTQWFETNRIDDFASTLLFTEFPQYFVWNKATKRWTRRQRGADKVVSRLVNVSLRNGELYYLRLLLLHVRGATSYDDVKTVGGVVCNTFQEACRRRNLLAEDREWIRSLTEASARAMPKQLRQMFAYILVYGTVDGPLDLWHLFRPSFIEDFTRRGHSNEEATNAAFREIQFTLMANGHRLSDFSLPEPPDFRFGAAGDDIDVDQEREQGDAMLGRLNNDQRAVFNTVLQAVLDDNQEQRLFYVTGDAGKGKTFLYNTLIAYLKGREIECFSVAWTGLAASLLRYGRTVHSTFRLDVPIMENTTSKILRQSEKAQEFRNAKLIIWDEVSMATCLSFDVVDRTLRFLCDDQRPFGNKCILIGGDFKQCLPVVPNGDRTMVVEACIKSSILWQKFERLRLMQNMRVGEGEQEFVRWLDDLGNDKLDIIQIDDRPSNTAVEVPSEYVVPSLDDLIQNVFGNLEPGNFPNKAILTPLNADCDRINDSILLKFAMLWKEFIMA